jgi:hypothetical protein
MPSHVNYSGEIATRLDEYRAHGRKEASANRPASDAARMDQHEGALQSDAEKWLASEQRIFDAMLTESSRSVVEVQQKTIALSTQVDQLLSDRSLQSTVETDMSTDRDQLIAVTESRMRAQVEWRYFRAHNGIVDQAVYPESHIWHFAIVGLLALIETAINAFFYENAQGLLGGFTVALGVAAINMGGALGLGAGFRFKNLSAIDKRVLGWLSLVAFILLSIYCNAVFAAFRAEYQVLTDPSDPMQLRHAFALATTEAKKVFYLDMHFADLITMVLFGLGLLLSCVAFYKGYTIDDRYPGYGRRDRALKKAQAEELARQDVLRQKIKDYLHRRRADIQAAVHEPAQLISRAASRIADLKHAQATLTTQAAAVQRDFALVLSAYRSANTGVRATEPPAYFRVTPDLTLRAAGAGGDQVIGDLARSQEELQKLREKNQDLLNSKLQEVQEKAASILNTAFQQFIRDVETEAEDRINRMTPAIDRVAA